MNSHSQGTYNITSRWWIKGYQKENIIPYQACSLQLYQILWSAEEIWSYNSPKQKNSKFKSYYCTLQCFSGYAMRTIPVFFVVLFKTLPPSFQPVWTLCQVTLKYLQSALSRGGEATSEEERKRGVSCRAHKVYFLTGKVSCFQVYFYIILLYFIPKKNSYSSAGLFRQLTVNEFTYWEQTETCLRFLFYQKLLTSYVPITNMGFEVLTAVTMKSILFWDERQSLRSGTCWLFD